VQARLESLDVFRGLTIAAMILVSTPGTWEAVYWPLEHAVWNGWTLADLVFPFLLFAMGAAVPFAMTRRRPSAPPADGGHGRDVRQGLSRHARRHILRRGVILFALGLLLNAIQTSPPLVWATFRIPGVLQRIALVYVAVAWLTESTSRRTQQIVAAGTLLAYWAAIALVPWPGAGPDRLGADNLAGFIDRALLGTHLAHDGWDPEGLLSTIPAIATALGGVFAGDWLARPGVSRRRSAALFAGGLSAVAGGLLWGAVFPINKGLWTSSFTLLSGGLAAVVLAVCHWLLDVRRWRGWETALLAFGRNPLAGYFLSVAVDAIVRRSTFGGDVPVEAAVYQHAFASWAVPCCGAEAASLLYALAYVGLWAVVLTAMYRRRIFIGI
jgi:predicted acyltransferase